MNQNKSNFFVIGLILLAIGSRLLNNHYSWLANFSPLAAIAIFGGMNFQKKWMAIVLPFTLMFLSDIIIALDNGTKLFHNYVFFTYSSFIVVAVLAILLKKFINTGTLVGMSLLSSIVFFLITNFAVWFMPNSGYPANAAGLMESYVAGIPFLKYTMTGDLFFTMVLFGSFEMLKRSNLVKANA